MQRRHQAVFGNHSAQTQVSHRRRQRSRLHHHHLRLAALRVGHHSVRALDADGPNHGQHIGARGPAAEVAHDQLNQPVLSRREREQGVVVGKTAAAVVVDCIDTRAHRAQHHVERQTLRSHFIHFTGQHAQVKPVEIARRVHACDQRLAHDQLLQIVLVDQRHQRNVGGHAEAHLGRRRGHQFHRHVCVLFRFGRLRLASFVCFLYGLSVLSHRLSFGGRFFFHRFIRRRRRERQTVGTHSVRTQRHDRGAGNQIRLLQNLALGVDQREHARYVRPDRERQRFARRPLSQRELAHHHRRAHDDEMFGRCGRRIRRPGRRQRVER